MTSVNKGVKRNQYIPPSFTRPLFPQLSSHLPSAPSHLYLCTPSRSCALSPSSVLHSFVQCPCCHSRSGIGQKNKQIFAFIPPPTAHHVGERLRVRSAEKMRCSRSFSFCPLIVCVAVLRIGGSAVQTEKGDW